MFTEKKRVEKIVNKTETNVQTICMKNEKNNHDEQNKQKKKINHKIQEKH